MTQILIALSALTAALMFALILWKRPALLILTSFAPLVLTVLFLIPSPIGYGPGECGSLALPSSSDIIQSFIIAAFFILDLLFMLGGIVLWIRTQQDKQKSQDAKEHILIGLLAIIVLIILFFVTNIIVSALGVGSIICLKIPTLGSPM